MYVENVIKNDGQTTSERAKQIAKEPTDALKGVRRHIQKYVGKPGGSVQVAV
jgi:hypothetical protein